MVVISIINMKGGVGKTTLATNICDCISRRENKKVLLVDIDPQFNSTQCLFRGDDYMSYLKEEKDTITSIFDNSVKIRTSTINGYNRQEVPQLDRIKPYEFKDGFYLIPGNLALYKLDFAAGSGKENKLKIFLNLSTQIFNWDYVFIDTPPTPSVWMTSALIASDYYLIPVKPDPISFVGIDLLENIIAEKKENYDLNIKCLGLIFNMVERHDSIVYRNALDSVNEGKLSKYKFRKYLPKRSVIPQSQLNQQFILDCKDSESRAALTSIVSEIIERINKNEY